MMEQEEGREVRTETEGAATRLLGVVRDLALELHPSEARTLAVTLDSTLDHDLGLDSLSRMELLSRIERAFGVAMNEVAVSRALSPRDLLREISGRSAVLGEAAVVSLEVTPLAGGASPLPLEAATLVEALEWHARLHPDRLHIRLYSDEGPGEVITYHDLYEEAKKAAATLAEHGIGRGEAVLIMLPTGRDYFVTFFAVLLAGGVPAPIYPPGNPRQMEEHLRRHAAIAGNCLARAMITVAEALPFARLMRSQVTSMGRVFTVQELMAGEGKTAVLPRLAGSDLAFLQYTSGSTGLPKGVVLSHANLLANVRAMGRAVGISGEDVFVSWLPLYHDMGLIGAWFGSLYHACPLVIMSPLAFIARPVRWLRAIHRFRGTIAAAPNFAYELCTRRISEEEAAGLDLSSWRYALNGAEAVRPETLDRFSERFKAHGFARSALMPVYGLAESSVGLAFPPTGRGPLVDRVRRETFSVQGLALPVAEGQGEALAFVSCGRPLPGHEIRVVDGADRELPDRQEGRLQFKGPSATSGYYRNPVETARLFHGDWLDSGDLAYTVAGEIYVTGRKKDIVIRAGRNIHPDEIEEAVGNLEGVRKGAVIVFGTPDPEAGTERLVVVAESRRRTEEARQELRKRINGLVADLAGAAADEVVLAPPNAVPKTSSGKIRRSACRTLYQQGTLGREAAPVWRQTLRFVLAGGRQWLGQTLRQGLALLYGAWVWFLFALAVPPFCLVLACLPGVERRWRFSGSSVRALARLIRLPLRIEGLDHLKASPSLLVANHASYLDSLIMVAALPRPIVFVAKAELAKIPLLRFLLGRLNVLFVERFDKEQSLADARGLVQAARSGRSLFFFAEGTFSRRPGLLPFRTGAFETAVAAGLGVTPIAIRGSRSALRAGSWLPRRTALGVTIGPPLTVEEARSTAGDDPWRQALALRDRCRVWLLRHTGEPDLDEERPELFQAGR